MQKALITISSALCVCVDDFRGEDDTETGHPGASPRGTGTPLYGPFCWGWGGSGGDLCSGGAAPGPVELRQDLHRLRQGQ